MGKFLLYDILAGKLGSFAFGLRSQDNFFSQPMHHSRSVLVNVRKYVKLADLAGDTFPIRPSREPILLESNLFDVGWLSKRKP